VQEIAEKVKKLSLGCSDAQPVSTSWILDSTLNLH